MRTEIAMKKSSLHEPGRAQAGFNKSSLAVFSAAVLMAAIAAASVADGANAPAAKLQSDKTQSADASAQPAHMLTLSDAQQKTTARSPT